MGLEEPILKCVCLYGTPTGKTFHTQQDVTRTHEHHVGPNTVAPNTTAGQEQSYEATHFTNKNMKPARGPQTEFF